MIPPVLQGVAGEAAPLIYGASLATLASWQAAAVAFGFVFAILLVAFVLERLGVGLHA